MRGVYVYRIESEISQHKEQKWEVQTNSPGIDLHLPPLLQLPFLHIQVNGKKLIKEAWEVIVIDILGKSLRIGLMSHEKNSKPLSLCQPVLFKIQVIKKEGAVMGLRLADGNALDFQFSAT